MTLSLSTAGGVSGNATDCTTYGYATDPTSSHRVIRYRFVPNAVDMVTARGVTSSASVGPCGEGEICGGRVVYDFGYWNFRYGIDFC